MAYSLDLRLKILSVCERGEQSQAEIASIFEIGTSTLTRWIRKKKNNEDLSPPATRSGRPKKIDEKGRKTIESLVLKQPGITLSELSKAYYKKHKLTLSTSILFRELKNLNLRYKKLSVHLVEKDTCEVKKKKIIFG